MKLREILIPRVEWFTVITVTVAVTLLNDQARTVHQSSPVNRFP